MKYRYFFIIPLFFLLVFLTSHTSAFACGDVGEVCCSQASSMDPNYLEGYCNGIYSCHIKNAAFSQDPDNPDYSECLDVPCGEKNQPCCNGICNKSNLECMDTMSGPYKDVCQIPTTPTPFPTMSSDISISTLYNPAPKIPLTSKITDLITQGGFNLIDFLFVIIGLVFLAMLIMAGWDYMFSSGDPKKVAAATTRLINALIGLVITVVAFLLVRLVTNMLGLGNLV